MDDDPERAEEVVTDDDAKPSVPLRSKLWILGIAGVFYVILFSMCGFVLLILFRS